MATEHDKTIVHDTVIEDVLLQSSRVVEVRISQFRALLAFLLLVFHFQFQLQSPNSTPDTFLNLGITVSLIALIFSIFVIVSHKKGQNISVTLMAICSIGLDATLMVLPVSLYFMSSRTPTPLISPPQSDVLLNQPTVFAMYLLVIASGLRFRKVAILGIIVNSCVLLSLMFMEILRSRATEQHDPLSLLAVKQHLLLLLCSALLAWLISTHTRVTTQKAAQAALQATTDALTGTFNRHHLRQHLDEQFESPDSSLHVIMVDADHFKSINDTLGHLVGDQVLIEIAQRLQLALRPTDLLARYGGEEFCVVVPDVEDKTALNIAERLRKSIQSRPIEGREVTISLGLSRRTESDTISCLLKRADQALYRSKEGGRNRVQQLWPEDDSCPSEEREKHNMRKQKGIVK